MTDLQKLANAAPWDGDLQSCAMCAEAAATWCVGGEGWCADCLARAAINAIAPAPDAHVAGLREAAEICQKEIESWPSRATDYACGASDAARRLRDAILASIKENGHE